jgi:nuclear protein localization family protein 4
MDLLTSDSPQGPLVHTFPVENRLPAANFQSLKAHLDKYKKFTYAQRLSDFHLLVFLSRYIGDAADIAQIAETVHNKGQIGEGYQLIIDSLASQ